MEYWENSLHKNLDPDDFPLLHYSTIPLLLFGYPILASFEKNLIFS